MSPADFNNFPKPDYVSYAVKYFDLYSANFNEDRIRAEVLSNLRRALDFMDAVTAMYKASGNVKYLDMLETSFRVLMEEFQKKPASMRGADEFFMGPDLARVYRVLRDEDRIQSGDEDLTLKALDIYINTNRIDDHNQVQATAIGAAMAANVFPNSVHAEKWRAYSDSVWEYWYKNRDIDEAATGYAAIHIRDVIRIAYETGRTDLLRTPEIKQWFRRYLSQQAPSGFMPEYGDDYFFSWDPWVFTFEHLATLLDDPEYADAARRLFYVGLHQGLPQLNSLNATWNTGMCIVFGYIAEAAMVSSFDKTRTVQIGSVVTTRTNKVGVQNIPDQLLLAANRNPGTPFVMSDVYGNGSHGHLNGKGSIQYYEAGNNPFFRGLNRHSFDARQNNTAMLIPKSHDGFPYGPLPSTRNNVNRAAPNVWYTDCLDLSLGYESSPENPNLRAYTGFQFRIEAVAGTQIIVDNFRLEGPAGVLVIENFSSLDNWKSSRCSLTTDALNGTAMAITLNRNETVFVSSGNELSHLEVDLTQYNRLVYDWKHTNSSGRTPTNLWIKVRSYNSVLPYEEAHKYIEMDAGQMINRSTILDAFAENKGGESYGEIVMDNHFTSGTKLIRRLLLTEEGILVIQDTLIPGPHSEEFIGGQVWWTYNVTESGPNWHNINAHANNDRYWFDAFKNEPLTNQCLVYYEEVAGRTFGIQRSDLMVRQGFLTGYSNLPPFITHSKQSVDPGIPVTFVTVLVPHQARPAEEVAGGISVKTTNVMKTDVSVQIPNGKIDITMNKNGSWDVERNGSKVLGKGGAPRTLPFNVP